LAGVREKGISSMWGGQEELADNVRVLPRVWSALEAVKGASHLMATISSAGDEAHSYPNQSKVDRFPGLEVYHGV
jgi:hypothetical protein